MEKKYELTDETMTLANGTVLHRIKALVDIDICGRKVKAGELGGWIEKEYNLSHEGKCWAFDEAKVFGNAKVYDNAQVFGNAQVFDNTWVFDNAKVYDNTKVYGHAMVYGDVEIKDNSVICYDAEIHSNNKKSDEAPFDLYKLIDDCISKKDRYVYIYVGEAGMSVSVYPLLDEESED